MKIAIAGYGIEGKSSYNYWSANPKNSITIVDQKMPECQLPEGVDTIIGEDAFEKLQDFDLVVRTAGLAPIKIKTNAKIWTATNEFFEKCPAQIIGVTGTKGKGTTASLIASILGEVDKKVWLVGNIGNPGLDIINQIQPNDIVIYELSSFQLWDIQKSPHIAVILYIEQEHLDVHYDMNEYINAKKNTTKYQVADDILVYNKLNHYAKTIADSSKARVVSYPDESTAHIQEGSFYYGEQIICSINVLKLLGHHNQDNTCAAIDVVWEFTHDIDAIKNGLSIFTGLPHRLQFVKEVGNIKYYDDSIATTPSSAIAALRSFDGSKVIILGGSSKGSDFSELGKELKKHDVRAILIGDESEKIANSCRIAGFSDYEIMNNTTMVEIVKKAKSLSKKGDVVLLSPASASFGLFKNYSDRGDQFIDAVMKL